MKIRMLMSIQIFQVLQTYLSAAGITALGILYLPHRVLFTGQTQKCLIPFTIMWIIRFLFMLQQKKQMNSWRIHIAICSDCPVQAFGSLRFTVLGVGRIWPCFSLRTLYLKKSRYKFSTTARCNGILPISTILSKGLSG